MFFHKKGKTKPFLFSARQVPKPWHTSTWTLQTKGRGKLRITFLNKSASREYLIQPDIVEYDRKTMIQPEFDLIQGTNTVK
jgi:hypothetical protein